MIDKSVYQLRQLIRNQDILVPELVEAYLSQIEIHDDSHQIMSLVSSTGIRLLADKAESTRVLSEELPYLYGIVVLVDDLLDVANTRSTYGCHAYAENIPELDSIAIRRLREAGALIIGKAATAELGVMIEETATNFICKSKLGDSFTSGGGSSGISAGMAMGYASAAIGLDSGGNVFLPAAFNGKFAFKPTHGRIAHTPIFSQGMMFPDVSLVTTTAVDCAILMNIVSGYSEIDPASIKMNNSDFEVACNRSVGSLTIAYAPSLWNAPIDTNHTEAISDIASAFKSLGCQVERKRPPIANLLEDWQTITSANLFFQHGEVYINKQESFGEVASSWIDNGQSVTSNQYIGAQRRILGLRVLLQAFFDHFDVLLIPAAGCVPFEYGQCPSNLVIADNNSTWQNYASMCAIGAISGFPTAHVPTSRNGAGLPVGILVMAKPGDDDLVLSVCAAFERLAE